jgi:hypothetical protein
VRIFEYIYVIHQFKCKCGKSLRGQQKRGKRGDGLIYHASNEGKNIIFDVTFTYPQRPSNITIGVHKDVTIAFKTRETAKFHKYKQIIQGHGHCGFTNSRDDNLWQRKRLHEKDHITATTGSQESQNQSAQSQTSIIE